MPTSPSLLPHGAPRVLFGCVAENSTKYLTQALRFVQSVRWFGGALADAAVIVAVVEDCRAGYRAEFEALGAAVRIVPRTSAWHGPSNKLQFLRLPELDTAEYVILSDCDVVVLDDLSEALQPGYLRAKPADFQTLPAALLVDLHRRSGRPLPDWQVRTSIDRVAMPPYCNSGFLIFHRDVLHAFSDAWWQDNTWCLTQRDVLGSHAFHCDQASFALALGSRQSLFSQLPIALNFPGHLQPARYPADLQGLIPRVLHYHDRVDGRSGGLAPIGLRGVDQRVAQFNRRLAQDQREHFSNAAFWDQRYLHEPDLGSGVGSRGEFAELKRRWVTEFVASEAVTTLLDFGCGDGAWIASVPIPDYVGIDVSAEVVSRNRVSFPARRFVESALDRCSERADHSLCLDVLIHQPSRESYLRTLRAVVDATARGGLINGYDRAPGMTSPIVFFHEPLCDSLQQLGLRVERVGEYRETTVYHWRRP